MQTAVIHSLNLSPKYAPGWGAWEVAREIVCNALDADQDGMVVESPDANTLIVTTTTEPDIAELFIMGEGSKGPGGSTVGQFGEGAKLAALVATRTEGSSLEVFVPGKRVNFLFEKLMDRDVLHASVDQDWSLSSGCKTVIRMQGVGNVTSGKILADRSDGPREKAKADPHVSIYCKGIFICQIKADSIWDWNLNGVTVNRDRSLVQQWDVVSSMGLWIQANATDEMLEAMIRSDQVMENDEAIKYYTSCTDFRNRYKAVFQKIHGNHAVLATSSIDSNAYAKNNGFKVVAVPEGSARVLVAAGVKTSEDIVPQSIDLVAIPTDEFTEQIKWLRSFDALISAPPASLRVYANNNVAKMGLAELDERRIWLNERLFAKGSEHELIHTYLHEMAHLMSDAGDATTKFEESLGYIMARLAIHLSDGRKELAA